MIRRAAAATLLLLAAACAGDDDRRDTSAAADTTATGRARAAAAVANAIAAKPEAADSILGAAGHTREEFEALMYDIAADSTMSAAYAAAKSR